MNLLTIENASKSYGEKVLFQDISFQLNKGDKIAIVAKNGTGKTTLLRVLAGQENAEGENQKRLIRKDISIGFLEQEPPFDESHTVLEAIFNSDNEKIKAVKEYEEAMQDVTNEEAVKKAMAKMDDLKAWDLEAKVKGLLSRFKIRNFDQHVSTLSGGQRKRLALAKLLMEQHDLLILDEPTNHLDMDMIEWLEEYLQQANLSLLMVTHDRYFLERVCNHIVELHQGKFYRYRGNYSEFLEKKFVREENDAIELGKSQKLMKKELQWIRRQPKARGTKAKSRVDNFEVIKDKASQTLDNSKVQISVKGNRMGSKILEANYISKSYDGVKMVHDFFYKFKKGEKVGIVGPNGVGKSTFLKLLTKEIRPDGGTVVVGGTIVFGYYTQDGIQLQEDKRVIEVVQDIAEYIPLEKGQKLSAAQLLERFLFDRKHQQVYVSQLSGGERRRLYLLTVLMQNPNFLILDEPTNDLDIVTLNILEDFLIDFEGCVVIVSHDRYFMDKVVDHIFVFEGEGKIKDYNGNYTEYRANYVPPADPNKKAPEKKVKEKPADGQRKLTYMERKELGQIEKAIDKLEKRKAEIMEAFNSPDLAPEEIEKLSIELGALNDTIEEKEMRWMELSEFA